MPEPCDEMENLVSRAMDGELQLKDRTGLEAHLEKCPDCRAVVRALTTLTAAFTATAVLPEAATDPPMVRSL